MWVLQFHSIYAKNHLLRQASLFLVLTLEGKIHFVSFCWTFRGKGFYGDIEYLFLLLHISENTVNRQKKNVYHAFRSKMLNIYHKNDIYIQSGP